MPISSPPLPGHLEPAAPKTQARESIAIGFVHTLWSNVFYAAAQWLLSMLIAKTGGAALLGDYAIAMAVITPMLALSNLSLRSVLVTDAADRFVLPQYFGLRLLTVSVTFVIGIAAFLLLPMAASASWLLALAILLYRTTESIGDITQGWFQKLGRMRVVANSLSIRAAAVGCLFPVSCAVFKRPDLGFLLLSATNLATTLFYEIPRTGRICFSREFLDARLLRLVVLSFPLAVGGLLNSIHVSVPRFFIAQWAGNSILGLFAAMTNLMVAGSMVASALGNTLSPRMATEFMQGGRKRFLQLAAVLFLSDLGIGLIGYGASYFFGEPVLRWAYTAEIARAHSELPQFAVMLTLMLFDAHVGLVLTAMHLFRVQLLLQLSKLAIAALLCLRHANQPAISYAVTALNYSLVAGVVGGCLIAGLRLHARSSNAGGTMPP